MYRNLHLYRFKYSVAITVCTVKRTTMGGLIKVHPESGITLTTNFVINIKYLKYCTFHVSKWVANSLHIDNGCPVQFHSLFIIHSSSS